MSAKVNESGEQAKEGPELFFGLIGAVGTDLDPVQGALTRSLSYVGYETRVLVLSSILREVEKWKDLPTEPLDSHINEHMNAGSELRKITGKGDALAVLAMQQIRNVRNDKLGDGGKTIPKCTYIFRSLKNPEEVRTLRRVYGAGSWIISAYSPRETRIKRLADKIAQTHHESRPDKFMPDSQALVRRDEYEADNGLGQDVSETFAMADIFINASDSDGLTFAVRRFIEALFHYPFHTPTRDENGMFHANASALRSSSLARQVGAAISTQDGDIVSVGSNDVPKVGGGLYWPGETDSRDFKLGHDASDRLKRDVLWDVLQRLRDANWFMKPIAKLKQNKMIEQALPIIEDARLMDLIEFGRSVHAEMTAMLNAAHRGVSVKDCILYTTTFPCHDCARSIVAAGIRRVVYIEPYPKSLAGELHEDSILIDSPKTNKDRVNFEPFVGIAPSRYMDLFSMVKRKEADGAIVSWKESGALPRYAGSSPTYLRSEAESVAILWRKLGSEGLKFVESEDQVKVGGKSKG